MISRKSEPVPPGIRLLTSILLYIPATNSRLSPGRKNPTIRPVSAKTINRISQSPPLLI
jgi:hypothetical protein